MNTYRINGLDADLWDLTVGTTHRLDVMRRRVAVTIPGMDGEVTAGRGTAAAPLLTLALHPAVPAGGNLDALSDDLAALVAAPTLTVQRVTPSGVREAAAELVSHTWDPSAFYAGQEDAGTITLTLPGVWWRDTTATTTALVAGSTALDVGSAPVTDAVIRFALDAANPILTDAQTDTGISVAYDAVATDYIYVDCGQLQAWKSASSSQWTRPSSSAAWLDALVSYPGPGPLRMTPAVTESGGVLSRRATLTSSHTASVRFKKAWW